MGRVIVFVVGVLVGVAVAQQVSRTPAGGRVLGAVNGTTAEFLRALSDSYRARLAEAR